MYAWSSLLILQSFLHKWLTRGSFRQQHQIAWFVDHNNPYIIESWVILLRCIIWNKLNVYCMWFFFLCVWVFFLSTWADFMSFGITNCQYKSILVKLMEENVLLCAFISHFFVCFPLVIKHPTHTHTYTQLKSKLWRLNAIGYVIMELFININGPSCAQALFLFDTAFRLIIYTV